MAACVFLLLFFVNYVVSDDRLTGDGYLKWPTNYHLYEEKIDLANGNLVSRDRYVPVHTEQGDFKQFCLQTVENGTVEFLPDVKSVNYTYQGTVNGYHLWKYEKKNLEHEIVAEFTLYTYRVYGNSTYFDVPRQYIIKDFSNGPTRIIKTDYYEYTNRTWNSTNSEHDQYSAGAKCIAIKQQSHQDVDTNISGNGSSEESDVFHSYKKSNAKSYDGGSEHELRKNIFLENLRMIEHHNSQNLSYQMGLNQFADRTPEEIAKMTGGLMLSTPTVGSHSFPHSDEEFMTLAQELPVTFDLRTEGHITPVKSQGSCGSCWAFAATAVVEGALARRLGRLVDLSEQALMDCSWGLGYTTTTWARGCDGGIVDTAYRYIIEHGLPMEYTYPYIVQDGVCHTTNLTTFKILGYAQPTPLNPQAMKVALHKYGPVSVEINFSQKMSLYSSGIFYDPDCNNITGASRHEMAVVGYGVRDGVDYWIMKNSHGPYWGQAGYILISAKDNNCFVLSQPFYAIV